MEKFDDYAIGFQAQELDKKTIKVLIRAGEVMKDALLIAQFPQNQHETIRTVLDAWEAAKKCAD